MTAAVLPPALPLEVIRHLNDLFTRFYVSAATYVFESDPYTVEGDAPLLDALQALLEEDRTHATLLANLLRMHDLVPEPGVFPYWHRDLNYLTVPYMANFVVESIEEDLRRIDKTGAETPDELRTVHTTLRAIRQERAARLEALRSPATEALVREAKAYQAATDAVRAVREERVAKEKAAAQKIAQDAKKARSAEPTAAELPDPNEEGISAKEKAKRTMMHKRAQKAAPAPAPAADLSDPNEEGISAKEKAKRTMMIKRAQRKAEGG